jgi:acetyl esterase/lipase
MNRMRNEVCSSVRGLNVATLVMAVAACLAADGSSSPSPARPGGAYAVFYDGIDGNDVANLTAAAAFRQERPSRTQWLTELDVPASTQERYGTVIRAFLLPPADGEYVFYVAADDSAQVFLSPGEDPAGRGLIARCDGWTAPHAWTATPAQTSPPVQLLRGRRYYLEVLHKQGGGPGHCAVGWRLPEGAFERPIPGVRLVAAPAPKPPGTTVTLNPKQPPATKFGHTRFPAGAHVKGPGFDFPMSYLLFLPKGYAEAANPWPLFVFLHGNTHQGANLDGILNEGPAKDLVDNPKLAEWFPFVALFPQLPNGMRFETNGAPQAVVGLIQQVVRTYRLDPDRVYLTGLSMGGQGTWHVALEAPYLFAAIAPICAPVVQPQRAAKDLKDVHTWIIVGGADGGYTQGSQEMARSLQAVGAPVTLTVVPNESHGVWGRYYPQRSFYEWFLAFRRPRAKNTAELGVVP